MVAFFSLSKAIRWGSGHWETAWLRAIAEAQDQFSMAFLSIAFIGGALAAEGWAKRLLWFGLAFIPLAIATVVAKGMLPG